MDLAIERCYLLFFSSKGVGFVTEKQVLTTALSSAILQLTEVLQLLKVGSGVKSPD